MVERRGVVGKEVVEIAKVFECHLKGGCNALCEEQSNVWAERSNGNIQGVEIIGRGYRRFKTMNLQSPFSAVARVFIQKNKGETRIRGGY